MKFFVSILVAAIPFASCAADQQYELTLRNNQFAPTELHIPSGKRIKLLINNQDASAEEFESYDLNREKVISGNTVGFVYIGPLSPGRYQYFGDFHPNTARGTVVAD